MLESLEVKHFRKFEGLRMEFSKGVTVLVGANGSGVSNFNWGRADAP